MEDKNYLVVVLQWTFWLGAFIYKKMRKIVELQFLEYFSYFIYSLFNIRIYFLTTSSLEQSLLAVNGIFAYLNFEK